MNIQTFGGDWTENKLVKLRKYLVAYATIMKDYNFKYAYIDAFAGTGYRTGKESEETDILIFPELINQESNKLFDGSARIALQVEPKFDQYIFIEKDENKVYELNKLKTEFTNMADRVTIINSDANIYIKDICSKNWKSHRSVLFLDPFGMQVPWATIECIAKTEAIDLWYLFPVGVAINRLLKKDGNIDEVIRKRLDETFGTTDWYDRFYQITNQIDLFGTYSITEKTADYKLICEYFIERLETVFAGVAKNPLLLCNSRNTPLYLLCFAAANKKGAKTAIKIAQDILKK
ncbi:three-Cys-motif partner protein TcmP [Floridanema evergladense]|uniref:Three-Cys-motif partner protein TcmP n=1 Tax=Floridaenema evergladense BLCC-F167 TaxID=3153639 RepID=A0ABV4WHT8_9CYAN